MNAYKPAYYHCETLDLSRKLALAGLGWALGLTSRGTYCAIALAISLAVISHHVRAWPYKLGADNVLRAVVELHVFVIVLVELAVKGETDNEDAHDTPTVLIIASFVCVLIVLVCVVVFKYQFARRIRGSTNIQDTFDRHKFGLARDEDVKRLQQFIHEMETEFVMPPLPGPAPPAGLKVDKTHRSEVKQGTDEDRKVWRTVQAKVAESLPEYRVVGIDRLQNAKLWHQYAFRRHQLSEIYGNANEKTLFHYSTPQVIRKIVEEGFETRLAREGEYGA